MYDPLYPQLIPPLRRELYHGVPRGQREHRRPTPSLHSHRRQRRLQLHKPLPGCPKRGDPLIIPSASLTLTHTPNPDVLTDNNDMDDEADAEKVNRHINTTIPTTASPPSLSRSASRKSTARSYATCRSGSTPPRPVFVWSSSSTRPRLLLLSCSRLLTEEDPFDGLPSSCCV